MSAARRQEPEGGWESLKVDELREELEARGLHKSGKKDELVARLEEDDAAWGEAPDTVAEEVIAPEEPAEEPSAEEVAAEGEAEPGAEAEAEPAARRRRGSAETTSTQRRAAPRRPDGPIVVRARAKYVRGAPRKARLVMSHIRGKDVEQAQALLRHAPRAVSADILKLLRSAVANAESAYELAPDELRIHRAFVDEGPTIKRYRPRALGRATRINKRTSHMTIELTTEGNGR
jgi:large subunit ribosomal protein L22